MSADSARRTLGTLQCPTYANDAFFYRGHVVLCMMRRDIPCMLRLPTELRRANSARHLPTPCTACPAPDRGHADAVHDVAWQPGGSGSVLTASADRTAALWDARSGRCTLRLQGHPAPVLSAAFGAQVPSSQASSRSAQHVFTSRASLHPVC